MNPTYPPQPLPVGSLDALPATAANAPAPINPLIMQMISAMMSGKGGTPSFQRKKRKPVANPY